MATSGALNEFARMPTQRKVLIFAVIGLALGGLYWQFIYKGLNEDLEQSQQANQRMAQENAKLAKDIPEYDKLKAKIGELEAKIAENQKALPTEAEVPAFFETLERKVKESGVEINKWKKLKEEPVESFVKVPVEIEINGTFMQIKRFFASLVQKGVTPVTPITPTIPGQVEEKERIVSVENLSLTSPVVRNREINLTAKFVAVTFRQEEKKPGKDTKKGAAAPAKSMAPASTPKGAKERTEDAIDKGDQKDRNAAGVDEAKTPVAPAKKLEGGM
ncbi:MAG: type 4a pilus biogenesis protein PilO [Kofleriaceae bacterium]